jgi:hypothetical protein
VSAAEVVAVVFVIIFVIGVVVGFITVVALSAVRKDQHGIERRPDMQHEGSWPTGSDDDEGADEEDDPDRPTGASGVPGHWDGMNPGDQPRWPESGNGFSGD